jgi:hypothetical protein
VTQGVYVVVEDADAHYARAKAAGAEIVLDIRTHAVAKGEFSMRDSSALRRHHHLPRKAESAAEPVDRKTTVAVTTRPAIPKAISGPSVLMTLG